MVKNLPAMQELQETWVPSLGWEDPLEEGMATHSSIFAWRIPWREEPGRLQSIGSQTVTHDSSNLACRHASIYSTMYKHTHTHTHTHIHNYHPLYCLPCTITICLLTRPSTQIRCFTWSFLLPTLLSWFHHILFLSLNQELNNR